MEKYNLTDNKTGAKAELFYTDDNTIKPVEYEIETEDKAFEEKLEKYFNTERLFLIPESQVIDDYREDKAVPSSELTYFEISLTEILSELDVDFNPVK